ncbi:MAG: 4Fe-4S dicluster domain-containing protein [Patescibacteria group bacterium]|nr:4Fe-4S dicluster domain-containing protein [Patescibacteria group bacterium]
MTLKNVVTLRQISQIVFLLIFLILLFRTEFRGTFPKTGSEQIRLPFTIEDFLKFDPLTGLATIIATYSLHEEMIWSVLLIILTLLMGRFFCGWACPLGTINHFCSYYKPTKKGKNRIEANRYKKWQSLKYYVLIVFLVAAFFTTLQIGLLDPLPLLTRSLSLSILPAVNLVFQSGLDLLYKSDVPFLQSFADGAYFIFSKFLFSFAPLLFHFGALIGILFIVILIFNRFIVRFWCRALCPLGALLGVFSRFSLFGMEKDHGACTQCNLCLLNCQGADEPIGGVPWKPHECHLCLNCQDVCPENVIHFKFFPGRESASQFKTDFSRRHVVSSLAAGFALLPIFRSSTSLDKNYDDRLIRPPGSLEEHEFLRRCIRCGACMKVCPTNAIQPTMLEAGLEGIWSPFLVMRVGYCEQTCVLCSQVCPTGAIWSIDEDTKSGKQNNKPISIGTAFVDRNRCLPFAMETPCIVCQEHCPTSPKAIYLKEQNIIKQDGTPATLQQPNVDPKLCWGCGLCEYVCPVKDKPAIYVTSIGETRSPNKQFILREQKK